MRLTLLFLPVILSGCATSAAGLAKGNVDASYSSAKPPEDVSGCFANLLQGTNPVFRLAPGHFVLIRPNGYGVPIVRYDFIATATGTSIERRSSIAISSGDDKLRTCL